MKYLKIFVASFVVTAMVYFAVALVLTPAPIPAEYWVREMTVIKRNIADHYSKRLSWAVHPFACA
jgi:hypothetical protein